MYKSPKQHKTYKRNFLKHLFKIISKILFYMFLSILFLYNLVLLNIIIYDIIDTKEVNLINTFMVTFYPIIISVLFYKIFKK